MSNPRSMNASSRPKQKTSHILRRLLAYLGPSKWALLLACIFAVLGNSLALLSPRLSGLAIDAISGSSVDFPLVYRFAFLLVLTAFLLVRTTLPLVRTICLPPRTPPDRVACGSFFTVRMV